MLLKFSSLLQLPLGILLLFDAVLCTTEWFGDLRAYLNPPKSPPFYDIVYDESDCPFGIESVAIPEFVYFGEMIATKSVREHSACLQFCLENQKCKAVNFFDSLSKKEPGMGFCELLVEGQYDNPRLMRPFRKATYYEKIHCRAGSEEEEQPFTFNGSDGKELLIGENNKTTNGSSSKQTKTPDEIEQQKNKAPKSGTVGHQQKLNQKTSQILQQQQLNLTSNANEETMSVDTNALKKLAEKVREFNDRFRS